MLPGYSFRGKPMAPMDRVKPRNYGIYIIAGGILLVILLLSALVWMLVAKFIPAKSDDESSKGGEIPIQAPVNPASASAVQNPGDKVKVLTAASPEAIKFLQDAETELKKDQLVKARDLALKAIDSGMKEDNTGWDRAAEIITKANTSLITSDLTSPEKQLYEVKKGDSLLKIAILFNTTIEAVQKSNKLDEADSNIHFGQTLHLYKGDWKIKVSKSRYKLCVYDGTKLFAVFGIGTGKQNRTPVGAFKISVKQRDPDWYSKGKKYPYGSPENILGTRWMALKAQEGTNTTITGFGIHGTTEPDSIGKSTSNGCIRLKNEDVDMLFMITPQGTEVVIEE